MASTKLPRKLDSSELGNNDLFYNPPGISQVDSRETQMPNENITLNIDIVIHKLLTKGRNSTKFVLTATETKALYFVSRQILSKENVYINVSAPINVVGDIHGQYLDLLRIFESAGHLPKTRYLFLGDYVDRGLKGLECLSLLLAYKIKYPNQIFLLRGNHETEMISRLYGFRQECVEKFGNARMWKFILKTFAMLPFAAIIEESMFCCHGGLSPVFLNRHFSNIADGFKGYRKPIEQIPESGLLCDLIWADPRDQTNQRDKPTGWRPNARGISWEFGCDVIDRFLEKFNLDMIVRGHQVVEDGYEFYNDRKLITIFSAPRYCGRFDNSGAVLSVEGLPSNNKNTQRWMAKFIILKPDYSLPNQWFSMGD